MNRVENEALVEALLEIRRSLEPHHISLIIGGGMGLYLRALYSKEERQRQYPKILELRSTNDLDLFLSAELIVDALKMEQLKIVLKDIGYTAREKGKYFQFVKNINLYRQQRQVRIDLLSALPDDAEKVKVKGIRIQPRGVHKIHARLIKEAEGIDIGKVELNLRELEKEEEVERSRIYVPSRFNYIILKLYAFHDRKDDEQIDLGRHHAYDIFATVTAMTQEDWKIARYHFESEKETGYIQRSAELQRQYFDKENDLGVLRLKENALYKNDKDEFDKYISAFLKDMGELFSSGN